MRLVVKGSVFGRKGVNVEARRTLTIEIVIGIAVNRRKCVAANPHITPPELSLRATCNGVIKAWRILVERRNLRDTQEQSAEKLIHHLSLNEKSLEGKVEPTIEKRSC